MHTVSLKSPDKGVRIFKFIYYFHTIKTICTLLDRTLYMINKFRKLASYGDDLLADIKA